MTPFTLLLHAHDHLWRMRDLPLDVRHEGCGILWRLALAALTPDEVWTKPIPIVTSCPKCGLQHIDVDDDSGAWATSRLHRVHLCKWEDGGCGNMWMPMDAYTVGVRAICAEGAIMSDCVERYPFDMQYGCIQNKGHEARGVPHTTIDGTTWLASRSYTFDGLAEPPLSNEQITRIAKRVFRYLAAVPEGGEQFLTNAAINCHDFVVPRIEEGIRSVICAEGATKR